MILAVDIGNTNIKIAVFKGKNIALRLRLSTDKKMRHQQYRARLKRFFIQEGIKPAAVEQIIICSVVPQLNSIFRKILSAFFQQKVLILGKDIQAPIRNLYRQPRQVGQDRLANAVAAVEKYGPPAIVVDFGTALTFDLISARGSYLGGIIFPGMELSLEALSQKAALLPKLSLKQLTRLPKHSALWGRDTISSMKSGIVFGYSFLVEQLLKHLQRQLPSKLNIIATGGQASLLFSRCPSIKRIDPDLTLVGLRLIAEKASRPKKGKNR